MHHAILRENRTGTNIAQNGKIATLNMGVFKSLVTSCATINKRRLPLPHKSI
jgi:hypothetical protein